MLLDYCSADINKYEVLYLGLDRLGNALSTLGAVTVGCDGTTKFLLDLGTVTIRQGPLES